MIVYLKTDSPVCEISLEGADGAQKAYTWEAGRSLAKDLLGYLKARLEEEQSSWADISGMVVFRGPGSFTGLRIGVTVANAIAYAQTIPVIGTEGENWQAEGRRRLIAGEDDRIVLPEYGREARITQPRK